eukprot:337215-Prymnesium_polylepis.1
MGRSDRQEIGKHVAVLLIHCVVERCAAVVVLQADACPQLVDQHLAHLQQPFRRRHVKRGAAVLISCIQGNLLLLTEEAHLIDIPTTRGDAHLTSSRAHRLTRRGRRRFL